MVVNDFSLEIFKEKFLYVSPYTTTNAADFFFYPRQNPLGLLVGVYIFLFDTKIWPINMLGGKKWLKEMKKGGNAYFFPDL